MKHEIGRILLVVGCLLTFLVPGCGDDAGGCPGIVCTNCAGSGDCNIDCAPPQVEFCGNFGYFDSPSARCAFCADPNFQP